MAERKRNANIELLRIIAMAMIVVLHVLKHSGYLPDSNVTVEVIPLAGFEIMATVMESFCIVAVNVYILISGYFGPESRFKPSKVVGFLCQVWFYTLLIPIVVSCLGIPILAEEEGVYGLIKYVLPVGTAHYWFVTCYFQLLLLMPLLNRAVRAMTQKQLTVVLACLLIPVCGIKSICPIKVVADNRGYDLLWFICLYLTGAWLRGFGTKALDFMKRKALPLYVGSSLVIAALVIALYYITGRIPATRHYFSLLWDYNFLLCLTGAVGLFFLFMNLNIIEGKAADIIRKVSKYCFGIYLFHEHLDIHDLWYPFLKDIVNPLQRNSVLMLFIELLACLIVIYGLGLCIDFTRTILFKAAAKCMKDTAVVKKIREADEIFAEK